MFDHVTIRVSDREASERFYETVLRTLGIERTYSGDDLAEWDEFSLAAGRDVTRRLHIGFAAASTTPPTCSTPTATTSRS
jgi:catechol 2,3-dioxygenase-like lactoylglutathione lyase family enzyme